MEDQSSGKKSSKMMKVWRKCHIFKFSLCFPIECFSKHPQKCHNILKTTTLHFFSFFSFSRDFAYLCDFITTFGYAVMQVLLAWSTWKYFPMCGIWSTSKEKNIIEVPWLVLFLYNITSIQNCSFVQCSMRASMKEPLVNNKQLHWSFQLKTR